MIEEDALVAIIERFLDELESVAGVEPVESVQVHYHSPTDEVLEFAFYLPLNRSINIASELIERAADEGGRWKDLARAAAYHEWGHALTHLIAANVGDDPNITLEHGLQDMARGSIEEVAVEHEEIERGRLVDAVRNLHDADLFEYDDLEVPEGHHVESAQDFVTVIEEVGLLRGPEYESNDPLGHSLGDSIAKHILGVGRKALRSGIIELANDLELVSKTGLTEGDQEQVRLAQKLADVPTATHVRLSYPEVDSEGVEVIVENGISLSSPPKQEVTLKMDGQRIFEGSVLTIPNKAQPEGGTFQSTVLSVDPQSGARVEFDTTTVEWVREESSGPV